MFNHSKIALVAFGLIAFTSQLYSQCAVSAPPDVSISCGSSTTLVAPPNPITYTVSTSSCPAIPITGTTAFPSACDDCVTGQIPIGFPFNFYGNVYTTAVIQSNGIVGFGPFTFTGFSSFAIPSGGNPNNYIAGFFADIDIRYGGTITYQTVGVAPNRKFVVSYDNCVPYGTSSATGTVSFQIILNEDGSFQAEVSQLSANWYSTTSGSLATQGAENIDGTYAFPVPGRNSTDWPAISPAALDCQLFNPIPCTFVRWEVGGTQVSTSSTYIVSPTSTTTYTGVWNCGGSLCYDNTVVSLSTGLTMGATTNNTNCSTPNGSIAFTTTGFANGTYTLNYTVNGTPTSSSVAVSSNAFTLSNLVGGTYANFSLSSGGCSASTVGSTTVTSPTTPTTTGVTICQGSASVAMTSSGCGAYEWYTAATGGSSIGTGASFNPVGVAGSGLANTNTPGTTTYYSACSVSPTCRTATTYTISPNSTVPTSISGTGSACHGSTVTLTRVGGSLAPGAVWQWYSGSCGGTFLGNGNSITVSPTASTTYFLRASAGTTCSASACVSGTITLPTAGSTLSNNNESAACVVNQNGYIHFYHSSGRFLGSINSLGQNLGSVTMTSYTGTPVNVFGCVPPIYVTAAMGRHWVITPQFQPTTPVDVLLPFDNSEYLSLQAAASINSNAYDDLLTLSDLKLSKYAGPLNVDANANNNCTTAGGNGGTTIHALSTSGAVSSVIGGFSASAQYGRFSIPSFSEFWLHGSNALSPLPVELITFSANCENDNLVKLKWSTATESNNDHFVIEKSYGDGSWNEIAQVQGAGNSQNIINYVYNDENYYRGTSYYRLIQVDYDGNETVYDLLSVNCNSNNSSIIVYPNPAQNNVTVEVSSNSILGETHLSVTDISGKLIFQRIVNLEEGQTIIPLNTSELSTGSYFITLKNASEQFSPIKIIIQK